MKNKVGERSKLFFFIPLMYVPREVPGLEFHLSIFYEDVVGNH